MFRLIRDERVAQASFIIIKLWLRRKESWENYSFMVILFGILN